MRFPTSTRPLALLLSLELAAGAAHAQATGGSPYSAYGLGDLVTTGQAVQAMAAGTGLGMAEPYSVTPGNPAGYTALARPVFESAAVFNATRSRSAAASSSERDLRFMGFTLGVPFAGGKWGLALGLLPFSNVGYSATRSAVADTIPVQYQYTGSGGLSRAFFGLGRTLFRQRPDSLGNAGTRISLGADFNFIFGNIAETRDAIYNKDDGYNNIRAFSSLFLTAPAADASLVWQGDLTKHTKRDQDNWRWTAGISMALPVNFKAAYTNLATSYVVQNGVETVRDTIAYLHEANGHLTAPVRMGLAAGVQNAQWGFTVERKQQDWSNTGVNVAGYAWAANMGNAATWAAAARYRPGGEGGILRRMVYRLGFSMGNAPQQVRGSSLNEAMVTGGVSIPLNTLQTNSWLHVGGSFGQRGTTADGLIAEQRASLWIGLAITPWRGERWFTPSRIQ